MPSETFYCPQCGRQLTKSAQAYLLGEAMSTKDSSFVMPGGMADTVTCPACGKAIDAKRMITGEYDRFASDKTGCFAIVGFVVAFALIVVAFEQPWWAGSIGGVVVGALAEMARIKARARG